MFNGGVVQVIDSLLIPPSNLSDTTNAFNLTSFQGAVYTTQQMTTFSETPNVTIFAPANEAFQALGSALTEMAVSELATIMDYMVLPDEVVYSTGLTNSTKFRTQQGGDITVLHFGNNVYINSAQLLASDILIANGVLHVIDNVLDWQAPSAQPNPALPTQVPVFPSANSVADLPFTSAIPCTVSCPVPSSTSESVTSGAGTKATSSAGSKSSSVSTSSSKGVGAPMARETGFGAAGLMVALGGAVMMI
jgi:transforming growth factor-beta-induced protein